MSFSCFVKLQAKFDQSNHCLCLEGQFQTSSVAMGQSELDIIANNQMSHGSFVDHETPLW